MATTRGIKDQEYFDPIGFIFTFSCIAPREDMTVKEMFLDFADEVLPMMTTPYAITFYQDIMPYKVAENMSMWFPGNGMSGRDIILEEIRNRTGVESPKLMYEDPLLWQVIIRVKCEDLPTIRYEDLPGGYEEEQRFFRLGKRNGVKKLTEAEFQRRMHRCLLNPDPTLKNVRLPIAYQKTLSPPFTTLIFYSVRISDLVKHRNGGEVTEEEKGYIEKDLYQHQIQIIVPRYVLADGVLPMEMQEMWKRRLISACEEVSVGNGALRMDNVRNTHIHATPYDIMQFRYPVSRMTDNLPGVAWGLALSRQQAKILEEKEVLSLENPLYSIEPMSNGGKYLQLTEDMNHCPIEPLVTLNRFFYPYMRRGIMEFDAASNILLTCRLPIEPSDLHVTCFENGSYSVSV